MISLNCFSINCPVHHCKNCNLEKIYFLVSFIIVCRYGLSKNRAELNKSFWLCILSQLYRVDTRNTEIACAILHSSHVE